MNNVYDVLFDGRDNARDRQLGKYWECRFCDLAAQHGKSFTPQQIGRAGSATWFTPTGKGVNPLLLPDITVWTAPGEHHETKHKKATSSGCYGLECYRLDALVAFRLETGQPVLYTIHDWELAGARDGCAPMTNDIAHWRTVDVTVLADYVTAEYLETRPFPTWVNGQRQLRPGYFWPVSLWHPLQWWWEENTHD
jgi:hypothetical protein